MENKAVPQIIGSSHAPYLNRLARRCGFAANFFAEAYPSLPNYIAMTSGSIHGIDTNGIPASYPLRGPSIFSQLGGHWRAFAESMPKNCELNNIPGTYPVHHNPAAYYSNVRRRCERQNRPLGRRPDISARFTMFVPNYCHSMHDCSISSGDRWLSRLLSRVFATREYRSGETVVFLTWDEDDGRHGNQIPTFVMSPSTPAGTTSSQTFNHYSLLRTTQELLRLRPFLGGAAAAPSMRRAFGV
jgi:hypothetical protein